MLRLSLEALEILDAIDRRGSFAAAAEEVHRVPSAITYMVKKLEDDLNVPIFDRSGHRAQLTTAGLELLNEGRHLLRAASELECRIKRVATGWETELAVVIDTLLPLELIFPWVKAFDALGSGTRLRLMRESLSGTWEALIDRRADLIIGAINTAPPGGGYVTHVLGELNDVFAVAADHPLASLPEPLPAREILQHRIVVVPDSARHMQAQTFGILSGQDMLRVPSMQEKLAAQVAGLGCGYLPRALAQPYLASGQLVARSVAEVHPANRTVAAWRSDTAGLALKWWVDQLATDNRISAWLAAKM